MKPWKAFKKGPTHVCYLCQTKYTVIVATMVPLQTNWIQFTAMIGNPCCKLEASATFHDGEIMGINDKGQAPFWTFGKK